MEDKNRDTVCVCVLLVRSYAECSPCWWHDREGLTVSKNYTEDVSCSCQNASSNNISRIQFSICLKAWHSRRLGEIH